MRYEHNGKQFLGGQYSIGSNVYDSEADAQKIVSKYPPGETAICFVDPNAPDSAVLSRELSRGGIWVYSFGGGIFLLFGSLLLLGGLWGN